MNLLIQKEDLALRLQIKYPKKAAQAVLLPRDTEVLLKSEDSRGHQSYQTAKLMDVRMIYVGLLHTCADDFLVADISKFE